MRRAADRLDPNGAPRRTHLGFTFEPGRGLVVNDKSQGCPLWYYGMDSYERAHAESASSLRK